MSSKKDAVPQRESVTYFGGPIPPSNSTACSRALQAFSMLLHAAPEIFAAREGLISLTKKQREGYQRQIDYARDVLDAVGAELAAELVLVSTDPQRSIRNFYAIVDELIENGAFDGLPDLGGILRPIRVGASLGGTERDESQIKRPEDLIGLRAAADLVKVSDDTIARRIKDGVLEPFFVGEQRKVSRAQVLATRALLRKRTARTKSISPKKLR